MIPVAYTAEAGNRILRVGVGHEDAGVPLAFRVLTAAVAPAGASGDCAFDRIRLAVTWSADAVVTVTPVLDGEPIAESHVLTLPAGEQRRSKVYELVLRRVSPRGSTYAVRGTWLALLIEGVVESAGDVIFDPATLEYEVLTPTQERTK